MLIRMKDVPPVPKNEIGNRGDQSFLVGARQ
jgi:hypothetical protein